MRSPGAATAARRAGGAVRRAALGLAVVAALGAVAVTRVALSARADLRAAEAALKRGETLVAVDAFERAARMRAPGLRAPRRALERLEQLGDLAEAAGDAATASAAFAAERRAILGSRALGTPERARLERANARLAGLLARADRSPGDERARRAWHAARLARDEAPGALFVVLALAGFGLWVGGGAALALRGFGPDDRLRRWWALAAAAAIVVGLALWLVGLAQA